MEDPQPKLNRIPQFVAIGVLLVALVLVLLGSGPMGELLLRGSRTSKALATLGVVTKTPTPSRPQASGTSTAPPTATAMPTATPPPREDHYLLQRPIAAQYEQRVAVFYPYGSRGGGAYPIHHGVEFVNPLGTPVLAAADGKVVFAGDDLTRVVGARSGFYGQVIIVEHPSLWHGQPVYTAYGHVAEVHVAEGDQVRAGQVIGLVGEEGSAEGPHLHFEVRYGQNAYTATVNPELWVEPVPSRGTLAAWIGSRDGTPAPELRVVIYRASRPDVPVRELLTYPDSQVNADPSWGENLVVGDLQAGDWILRTYAAGVYYEEPFAVRPGATTFLAVTTSS
jgi:murein DD-endopeptidase MepM/ murein hydrolase activator NlpD